MLLEKTSEEQNTNEADRTKEMMAGLFGYHNYSINNIGENSLEIVKIICEQFFIRNKNSDKSQYALIKELD